MFQTTVFYNEENGSELAVIILQSSFTKISSVQLCNLNFIFYTEFFFIAR